MDFQDDKLLKKSRNKKKVVSLSDDAYNELFNSVINSAANMSIENDSCGSNNDFNKEHSISNACSTTKSIQNKPDTRKDCGSNEQNVLMKKKAPKFNAPVKGNALKNIFSNKQIQDKKSVLPSTDVFKKKEGLCVVKNSTEKSDCSKVKSNSMKSKQASEINAFPENVELMEFENTHNMSANKEKQMKRKEKKSDIGNSLQNVLTEVSPNSQSQSLQRKKKNDQLQTTYKEADSTEQANDTVKNKINSPNFSNKENTFSKCKNTNMNERKNLANNKQSDNIRNISARTGESSEKTIKNTESQAIDVLQNFELSQASDGSLLICENSYTQLSQPSPELNQRQRLEWLRKRRDIGVWVQCCKLHCSKWRYLDNVRDPIDVSEYWACHMNTDKRYNGCDKPEKGPKLNEQIDLIDNKYTAGSVVWARVDGFPWWPALVDDDPDVEAYYWLNGFSDIPTHYHVVFFDEQEVSRAWVTPGKIYPFKGNEKQKKFNVKYFRGINYTARITAAKEQATLAYSLEQKDRLEQYGFIARYKGPIGEKKIFKSKHNRKVSSASKANLSDDDDDDDDDDYDTSFKSKKSKMNTKKDTKMKNERLTKVYSKPKKTCNENKKTHKIHKSHSPNERNTQNLKSNLATEESCINNAKDLASTESFKSGSEKTQTLVHTSQTETNKDTINEEQTTVETPNSPSIFDVDKANSADLHTLEDTKQDSNDYIAISSTDSGDIDPFEDEESIESNLRAQCEYYENHTEYNPSCSNMATVGTYCGKQSNEKKQDVLQYSVGGNIKFPPKKMKLADVERHEADTSDDATLSQAYSNTPYHILHNNVNSANTTGNNSDRETLTQSIQHSSLNTAQSISEETDAVVPEVEHNESDSDPFEADD